MYFPRPDLLRVSLPSLLSSLSVSDPLPVCDRVWGFWLCKAGPQAQVVISHHSHRSALRLPPALVLLSYQTLYSSILTSIYLHLSSSCPCQNGLPYPRPPPYCENTTPYQSFSMLSKHKGSWGVSMKCSDGCFQTGRSSDEVLCLRNATFLTANESEGRSREKGLFFSGGQHVNHCQCQHRLHRLSFFVHVFEAVVCVIVSPSSTVISDTQLQINVLEQSWS